MECGRIIVSGAEVQGGVGGEEMLDRKEEERRSRIGRRKEMILLCVGEDVQQPGREKRGKDGRGREMG